MANESFQPLGRLVIETLSDVSPDRRCFRLIGGVLVERTVKEVSPALTANREKISTLIQTMEKQLEEKGKEINAYMEEHSIQVSNVKKGLKSKIHKTYTIH